MNGIALQRWEKSCSTFAGHRFKTKNIYNLLDQIKQDEYGCNKNNKDAH